MAVIDKNMYEKLKKWCDYGKEVRPKNQFVMYVNSHDRALTDATIRKLMFEMKEEDLHGELYMSLYSAVNFYNNMRDYYAHIAELYMRKPDEEDLLLDIINAYPPTCGWIVLIVEDIETLSEDSKKMQEMLKTILAFACKRSSIVLTGNGDYKDVFSSCEYALHEMYDGVTAKADSDRLMIGCYEQEKAPAQETVCFESPEKQRDELNCYWNVLYKQLDKRYFDYDHFKDLYKETLEYIIPRVTKDHVYRTDLWLIENIGKMSRYDHKDIEGCKPWEFEAAQEFAKGLHRAIINISTYGDNDEFSSGIIEIDVKIEERSEHYGTIHISGYAIDTIKVDVESVFREMDELAETILGCTYNGNSLQLWKYLRRKYV